MPPATTSARAVSDAGSAKASGMASSRLVGRTRIAIPIAAPAPRAHAFRRRDLTARRIAARAQNVAVTSLIGWIAWPMKTGQAARTAVVTDAEARESDSSRARRYSR